MKRLSVNLVEQAQRGDGMAMASVVEHCTDNEIFKGMLARWSKDFVLDDIDDLKSVATLKLLLDLDDYDFRLDVPFEKYFVICFKRLLVSRAKRSAIERDRFCPLDNLDFVGMENDEEDVLIGRIDVNRFVNQVGGRQKDVAELAMKGFKNKEIAEMVHVTSETVKTDLEKLGNGLILRGMASVPA